MRWDGIPWELRLLHFSFGWRGYAFRTPMYLRTSGPVTWHSQPHYKWLLFLSHRHIHIHHCPSHINFFAAFYFFFLLSCVIALGVQQFKFKSEFSPQTFFLLQTPFCKLASNSHIITVFLLFFIHGFVFVFLHFQFNLVMFNSCSSQLLTRWSRIVFFARCGVLKIRGIWAFES